MKKKLRPKKPFHRCQGTEKGKSDLFKEKFLDDGFYWEITDLALDPIDITISQPTSI